MLTTIWSALLVMVLTRSSTRNNILLDVQQSELNNDLNTSISISLPYNSTNSILENSEQETVLHNLNLNMNNQASNLPMTNDSNQISSFKLPPFWISCPEAWFIQTEMQFNVKRVIDDTIKYQHVIIALPQEVITKILDILQNPPTVNKYGFIKKVLCDRFSLSEEKRLEQLFSDKQIGDRKPSEFYRDMSNIAGSVTMIGSDLLYKLWLRKLPQELQIHLTSTNLENLDDKLNLADKIWDVLHKNQISQINSGCVTNDNQNLFEHFSKITSQICQNLDKLSIEVSEIRSARPKDRNNSNNRRNSRSRSRPKFDKCWYHFKYGSNARRCIPPCNFVQENPNSTNLN